MELKKSREKIRLEFVEAKGSAQKKREEVVKALLRRNSGEKEGNTTSISEKGMV